MKLDQFTKTNAPVSCLIHFVNPVGIKLAEILAEQGSKVVLIDSYSTAKKKLIEPLLKNEQCIFMDIDSTFKNLEKFKKIDYMYYFIDSMVVGSNFPSAKHEQEEMLSLTHRDFTKETNRLDAYLKLAIEFDAKFELITAGYLSQLTQLPAEQNIQLQRYCESLLMDYYAKTRFNGRIVRMAEVYGEHLDLSVPTNFSRLVREVLFEDKVNIYGEGLQNNYFVHYSDAVFGLLKINFSDKTKGKTYMLADQSPITTLSMAYRLLEITPDEKEVVFNEITSEQEEIMQFRDISNVPNAVETGWEQSVNFAKGIQESLLSVAKHFKRHWEPTHVEQPESESGEQKQIEVPQKGAKLKQDAKVTRELLWYRFDYFFLKLYKNFVQKPFKTAIDMPEKIVDNSAKAISGFRINVLPYLLSLVLIGILVYVLLPYISLGILGTRAYFIVKDIEKDVASYNTEKLIKDSEALAPVTTDIKRNLKSISYLRSFGGNTTKLYDNTALLAEGIDFYAKGLPQLAYGSEPLINYVKEFQIVAVNNPSGQGSRDYFTEIAKIEQRSTSIHKGLQFIKLGSDIINTVEIGVFPDFVRDDVSKLKSTSIEYTEYADTLAEYYEFLPFLLGYKQRTNYLVMVTNESEIRSNGGWFTNYAIMGLENGKMRELTVDDVYNVDGQVTAKQAPQSMVEGISVNSYKFSLSNWSPDFKTSALEAESFLKQSGKTTNVDVFIALNFTIIRDLLRITGPIETTEYGQVTADNLYDKVTELHSNFTPGSQQKVTLVSEILPKIFSKLESGTMEQKREVLQMFSSAIADRDMMIYTKDTALQSLFETYKTSLIFDKSKSYVGVIDWNWSGNKTNRFVTRESSIEINEELKTVKVDTTYKNASTSNAYPQGVYKNYQRIIVPSDWSVKNITGYSNPLKMYSENGLTFSGQLIEVPIAATRNFSAVFAYDTLPKAVELFKQPGIEKEAFTITVIQSGNSIISDQQLQLQGFTKNGNIWTKTLLRNGDITVTIQ
jgi:nucleoside-diphosphate-sugar epimerase